MRKIFALLQLIIFTSTLNAQVIKEFCEVEWDTPEHIAIDEDLQFNRLGFRYAAYDNVFSTVPQFVKLFDVEDNLSIESVSLVNPVFLPLTDEELLIVEDENIAEDIEIDYQINQQRNQRKAKISFTPIRNGAAGIEKLTAFNLKINLKKEDSEKKNTTFVTSSVLSQGDWYKFKIGDDGMYKITYSDLKEWGVDMDNLNLNTIGVFGNTGMMLPEMNNEERPMDLQENPIFIEDNGDGQFNSGDYIAFFAKGTVYWEYKSTTLKYNHHINYYTDDAYYFFTPTEGTAMSFETIASSSETPNEEVTTYDHYQYYEQNEISIMKSGRVWYNGTMTASSSTFTLPDFEFQHVVSGSRPYIETKLAAYSVYDTDVDVIVNDETIYSQTIQDANGTYDYGESSSSRSKFDESGDTYSVQLKYNAPSYSASAWIDWVELSARCELIYPGGSFAFRDKESAGTGNVSRFTISNASDIDAVLDITDPREPKKIIPATSGSTLSFVVSTEERKEFLAVDFDDLMRVDFQSTIENQDLHAISNIDYLIITHPDYYSEALRLAQHRETNDGLSYFITTPQLIYNEFSSGAQDITAIRDFVRNVYQTSDDSQKLKYLLLFGNASYDFLDRIEDNTNFVPSFQSYNHLNETSSFVSDDYFGLLDDNEGYYSSADGFSGYLDIGIGRFPAETQEHAQIFVDKTIDYDTNKDTYGSWRNDICLLADDEDSNTHLENSDELGDIVDENYKEYNLHKIYIDAYEQETSPGGERYPIVNDLIKARMEKGILIFNYVGHGGVESLAQERIVSISDIEGWTNVDALPLFITATCEFSRYDEPELESAGEKVILNPGGGGIAMLTTSRLAFSHTNKALNERVFNSLYECDEQGNYPRLGDMVIAAKTPNNEYIYNFVLLGDPALQLAYPEYNVQMTHINDQLVDTFSDSLRALEYVSIKGEVTDLDGNRMSNFNGIVYTKVFDKEYAAETLGNDADSDVTSFQVQDNILYQGKSSVVNGAFELEFIMPNDINYAFGKGKISFYAHSDTQDANGYDETLTIGGTATTTSQDLTGPSIELYLNDRSFVSDDVVNESPMLIADLFDESGLNTTGNGFGHDLLVTLDGDDDNPITLNDYYSADLDSYKSGTAEYFLNSLDNGVHTLTVEAWDVYNNSSEKTIRFVVSDDIKPDIINMYAVPNPFDTETAIQIEHNQFGERLTVTVQIYDISGRLIRNMGPYDKQSDLFSISPITWDGEDNYGNRVDKGIYIYSVMMINEIDVVHREGGKLVKTN